MLKFASEGNNNNMIFIMVAIIVGVLALIFFIATYVIDGLYQQKYNGKIKDSVNSLRVYIVDVKNDNVRFFNRSNLRRRRTITMTDFYNQFPATEREKIIAWIGDLLNKETDTPTYFEINVMISRNHKNIFSILQVDKIDYEKQLIYLESYLLRYITTAKNKKNSEFSNFTSVDAFSKQLVRNNFKGFTVCFNFFEKKSIGDEISHITYAQLKDALTPYLNQKLLMLSYNEHQIVACDFKATTKQGVLRLISTLKVEINRLLTITSEDSTIGFTIGVVDNSFFPNDAEKIIETALALSDVAREDDEEIIFYEEGRNIEANRDTQHYRTEVERIIQDKRLKYLYRPIYDAPRGRTLGYQMFVQPLDSFFGSIEELKSYAIRTEDDRELFATVARNGISRFIQERDGVTFKLFFPVSLNELNYINRTMSHIQNIKDTRIVLVCDENELVDLPTESSDSFLSMVRLFKSKGYEVALAINDNDLTLSPVLYESFDAYLISVKAHISRKNNSRQLPSFKRLVEKLLHFQKPIIATDIPSWDIVELILKYGIGLVSSEVIAPMDENILPISKKSITKIKSIKV